MTWIKILLFSCLSALGMSTAHDFHASRSLVNYNPETENFEIIVNLFIDDMELALTNFSGEKVNLFEDLNMAQDTIGDGLIQDYLAQKFVVTHDGKPLNMMLLGKELQDDPTAFSCYIEIEAPAELDKMSIENKILLEEFDDQMNLVDILNLKGKRKSHLLNKKLTSVSFAL